MMPNRDDYVAAATQIAVLVHNKQLSYGGERDAVTTVAQIMKLLWPQGLPPEQYEVAGVIIRLLDKVCRLTLGDRSRFPEEHEWDDIMGYALRMKLRTSHGNGKQLPATPTTI